MQAELACYAGLWAVAESGGTLGGWSLDRSTGEVSWTDGLYEILGFERGRHEPSTERMRMAVHPDHAGRVDDLFLFDEGAEERSASLRLLHRGGAEHDVRMVVRRITHGLGECLVGVVFDETGSRAAAQQVERTESMLRVADALGNVGLFFFDGSGVGADWSPAMFTMLGAERVDTQEEWEQRIDERDLTTYRLFVADLQESGSAGPVVLRLLRGDGILRNVMLRSQRVEGGVCGSLVDITERVHLEERLRHAQKMDAVGRLATGVAHQFNNLLTIIAGNADLLGAKPEVDQILEACARGTELVQQLQRMERDAPTDQSVIDLNSVVGRTLELVRKLIGADVEVEFKPGRNLWPVRADAAQIGQVVAHLAVNARDAMPHGGCLTLRSRNVTLSADRRPQNARSGAFVELSVVDTGFGMDEATQQRIYEPFFTTKDGPDRSGLGLSTVHSMVAQHEGAVEVSSRLGQGTEFRVYLPRAGAPPVGTPSLPVGHCSGRVLVVEDEVQVRSLVHRFLERAGYEVVVAIDAAQAAKLFDDTIGLLVTDVILPGEDGIELADRLRRQKPGLPVVFMTGYSVRSTEHAGGVTLQKPFRRSDLLDAVARSLAEVVAPP